GTSILVKGTATGIATDLAGRYVISVPKEATLVFSFIGYETQEVQIGSRSVIDIILMADLGSLEEVVVVGYGTQKRRDVTGAIASVQTENIRDLPMQGIDQALAGQIAGVRAQQTTGAPGGGINVQIRGTGSISAGGQPLYVIDGFPVSHSFNQ